LAARQLQGLLERVQRPVVLVHHAGQVTTLSGDQLRHALEQRERGLLRRAQR
jgi:hypothetical protein